MGMGSFAVGSFVIEYKDLKKICPNEIKAIEKEKDFKEIGWGNIGRWLTWDDPDNITCMFDDEVSEELLQTYDKLITDLKRSFNKKTKLTLYFDSYDEDGGSGYDNPGDKDGCIFCVNGMLQLTPAGEKFKDIITERKWTQFG